MTYANVIFSYGSERFISACADSGIDGLILPDLPFEEKSEFSPICQKYGVDLISLIAPTSENRTAMIAKEAEGFVYIVSSLGVTGTRSEIKTDLSSIIDIVRQNTDIPCAVGFGISTPRRRKRWLKSPTEPLSAQRSSSCSKNTEKRPEPIGRYKIHERRHSSGAVKSRPAVFPHSRKIFDFTASLQISA